MRVPRKGLRTTFAVLAVVLTVLTVPAVATYRTTHTPHRATDAKAAPGTAGRSASHGTARDTDHDGIPNARDQCPNRPERYNGYRDGDGCPDVVARTGAS